ncbi:hypothetical protein Nmel_010796 [Mimus melanotis]
MNVSCLLGPEDFLSPPGLGPVLTSAACAAGACPVSPAIKSANWIHFSFICVLFFQFCAYHVAYSGHQEPRSFWSSTWSKMAAKGGKSCGFPGSGMALVLLLQPTQTALC